VAYSRLKFTLYFY